MGDLTTVVGLLCWMCLRLPHGYSIWLFIGFISLWVV